MMEFLDDVDRFDFDIDVRKGQLKTTLNCLEYFDDHEYEQRFRLTKESTRLLNNLLSPYIEEKKKSWSLSRIDKIMIALRYYACGSIQRLIGDFHHVDQSTISRSINTVTNAICLLRDSYIKRYDSISTTKAGFYTIAEFPNVIGCIDGTHVKLQKPSLPNAEDFINRKGFCSINCQVVCDDQYRIIDIVVRWPGSVHDARVFDNSTLKVSLEENHHNGVLLGDNAYPSRQYLLTPLLQPQTTQQRAYNSSHIKTRNVIERCFGILKRRFLCLQYGLRHSARRSCKIILATAILHNFIIEHQKENCNVYTDVPQINEENEILPVAPNTGAGNHFRNAFIENHFH